MARVTEYEYEEGWGASVRPDGIVFSYDKNILVDHFDKCGSRNLYETISKPTLVRVSEECHNQYVLAGKPFIWLRGKALESFMQGVYL
jgi:hypothetical protein